MSDEPTTADPQPVGSGGQRFCDHCGGELAVGSHQSCERLRLLEPPRYCSVCARRMVVQVVPRGWTAICSRHGLVRVGSTGLA
ncbi:MAG: hypothetical protein ACRDPG_06690 [Nocardioidaceae bacterium]